MNRAISDSLVGGFEQLEAGLTAIPDPDDRHVLAAAIHCGAQEIVTLNLRDFPDAVLQPYGIRAIHPDSFVEHVLDLNLEAVCEALRRIRRRLVNPPIAAQQMIEGYERNGLAVIPQLKGFADLPDCHPFPRDLIHQRSERFRPHVRAVVRGEERRPRKLLDSLEASLHDCCGLGSQGQDVQPRFRARPLRIVELDCERIQIDVRGFPPQELRRPLHAQAERELQGVFLRRHSPAFWFRRALRGDVALAGAADFEWRPVPMIGLHIRSIVVSRPARVASAVRRRFGRPVEARQGVGFGYERQRAGD